MPSETLTLPKPANAVIRVGTDIRPYIEGFRCDECGGVFTEATLACRSCGTRAAPEAFKAGEHGRLYSWSVVERSYPGIAVPFVSAIVDLDDGLTLKGTLRDVNHGALEQGMPVQLVFDDAGGATDKDGAPYVGFHFVPEGASQ